MIDLMIFMFSVFLGTVRILGQKDEIFQAVAHVWVGGLFAAGILGKRWCLLCAVGLTIVEVMCFLMLGRNSSH